MIGARECYGSFISNSYSKDKGEKASSLCIRIMNQKTIDRIRKFTSDRDWEQFHTPANLAKSISIEAGELLECFQWNDTDYDKEHVKEELADVLVYCQNMLDELGLDADEIINEKMDKNEAKYPVEKAKGFATKYNKL